MWKSMQLSDSELRALVRDAIARHGQREAPEAPEGPAIHASHGLLPLQRGSDGDGACLIEPDVRCNHCGYCLSFGH
jgi:hypothetical protein